MHKIFFIILLVSMRIVFLALSEGGNSCRVKCQPLLWYSALSIIFYIVVDWAICSFRALDAAMIVEGEVGLAR